jgi:hypothetical protein
VCVCVCVCVCMCVCAYVCQLTTNDLPPVLKARTISILGFAENIPN